MYLYITALTSTSIIDVGAENQSKCRPVCLIVCIAKCLRLLTVVGAHDNFVFHVLADCSNGRACCYAWCVRLSPSTVMLYIAAKWCVLEQKIGYYWHPTGSCIWEINWCQNEWPWSMLKGLWSFQAWPQTSWSGDTCRYNKTMHAKMTGNVVSGTLMITQECQNVYIGQNVKHRIFNISRKDYFWRTIFISW